MQFKKLMSMLEERKLSVYRLARMTGINQQSLYHALHGHVTMWPGWKKRIAAALDMTVEDLFPEVDCDED